MGARRKSPLPERVVRFAKEYVQLVEALQLEGVPADVAREEARLAAVTFTLNEDDRPAPVYDPAAGPCPTCGRG